MTALGPIGLAVLPGAVEQEEGRRAVAEEAKVHTAAAVAAAVAVAIAVVHRVTKVPDKEASALTKGRSIRQPCRASCLYRIS